MKVFDSSDRLTGAARSVAAAVVFVVACILPVSLSAAGQIDIRVRDCRSNIDVQVRNERLSTVFARLAKALDFKLSLAGADPLINVNLSAPGPQVVAALAAEHGSFMIQQASDSRCPGQALC